MNSPSPSLQLASWSADREHHLRRWSIEWEIEQILDDADDAVPVEESAEASGSGEDDGREAALALVRDYDPGLEAGEIRLLRPGLLPRVSRPVYVALLQVLSGSRFVIAPFSRFSHPAVSGEWLTGMSSPALRVLCIWNARVVPGELLAQSWRTGRLDDVRHDQALQVRAAHLDHTPLAPELDKDVGPPLSDFSEIRGDYLWEERNHFGTLGLEDGADLAAWGWEQSLHGLGLAAATAEVTGTVKCLRYPGTRRTLQLDSARGVKATFLGGLKRVPVIVRDPSAPTPLLRLDLRSIGLEPSFQGPIDLYDSRMGRVLGRGVVRELVADLDLSGTAPRRTRLLQESDWFLVIYLDRDESSCNP